MATGSLLFADLTSATGFVQAGSGEQNPLITLQSAASIPGTTIANTDGLLYIPSLYALYAAGAQASGVTNLLYGAYIMDFSLPQTAMSSSGIGNIYVVVAFPGEGNAYAKPNSVDVLVQLLSQGKTALSTVYTVTKGNLLEDVPVDSSVFNYSPTWAVQIALTNLFPEITQTDITYRMTCEIYPNYSQ